MSGRTENSGHLFSWLWRNYLWKHRWLLLVALAFMSIEGAMFGLLSYMMKPMFDNVFVGGNSDAIWWVGLVIFGSFLARAVASVIQKVLMSQIAQITVGDIRNDLVSHLISLDGTFHQAYGPGYLMQRVEGDVGSIAKVSCR